MSLIQQIANTLYDGTYPITPSGEISFADELNAVRPIPVTTGYVSFAWSARFVIDDGLGYDDSFYDYVTHRGVMCYGYYEIRGGLTPISRFPIDSKRVGTPKVNGIGLNTGGLEPGQTYVKGSGATVVSVNNAADRPYRGDTLYYEFADGVTGTIYVAVNTGFVDNLSNANKYIIHP